MLVDEEPYNFPLQKGEGMKTALFVDFDNVFSGLRRLDPAYAHKFGNRPSEWIKWLSEKLPLPPYVNGDAQRRILVRRCYLNPSVYQQYRIGFSMAGFEIVDCPPMTQAGKTSTDIHMVLDMVDVLQHNTHYDEFIVFSADADFSPVLRKLRRSDRRTTVLAAGETSSAYQASADLMIDADDFINEALGFGDQGSESEHREPIFHTQRNQGNSQQIEQVQRIIFRTVDRADAPVPLEYLADELVALMPNRSINGWTDEAEFSTFLSHLALSPLIVDRANSTIWDPRRGEPRKDINIHDDVPDSESSSTPVELTAEDVVIQEVASSNRPVACASLAHAVRNRASNLGPDWSGLGTFRKFLDSLTLTGLEVRWTYQGGVVLDPARHSVPDDSLDEALQAREALWIQVSPIFGMSNLPPLTPRKYGVVLTCLSEVLAQSKFNLLDTCKSVCDRTIAMHEAVSRKDINQLLRAMLFGGFDPETDQTDVASLTATVCGVGLAACARERVEVDDSLRAAVLQWIGGEAVSVKP